MVSNDFVAIHSETHSVVGLSKPTPGSSETQHGYISRPLRGSSETQHGSFQTPAWV
jgi:hypothetical protein